VRTKNRTFLLSEYMYSIPYRGGDMEKSLLEKQIFDLECLLLQPFVRRSAEKIAELLAEDFFEFCSSGKVYRYKKGDVFDDVNTPAADREITDFTVRELSCDTVLATYKIIQNHKTPNQKTYSLRSSVWKCFNGQWKIIFHQGTLTEKP
jgi:hypothetical protein